MRRTATHASLLLLVVLIAALGCGGDSGTTPPPPPPAAPTVTGVTPLDGALDQLRNIDIVVTFDKAMNVTNVQANFTVEDGGVPISGTIAASVGDTVFTFTPNGAIPPLGLNKPYTVRVKAGTLAADGGALAAEFTSTFRTHNGLQLLAVNPANGAAGVGTNAVVTVTFNLPLDQTTVTPAGRFTLTENGVGPVTGAITFSGDGKSAIFTPAAALTASALHDVHADALIAAPDGSTLGSSSDTTFATGAAPDTTPPTVTTVQPTSGSTDRPLNQRVDVIFDEAINPATVTDLTFVVRVQGGAQVTGGAFAFVSSNAEVLWTPPANLAFNTTYEVEVLGGGITDTSGNSFDQDGIAGVPITSFTSTFTTDATAPKVQTTTPANAATCVNRTAPIVINFDEAMDNTGLGTVANYSFSPAATFTAVAGGGDTSVTLTPTAALALGTTYTVTVLDTLTDANGVALDGDADGTPGGNYVFTFDIPASGVVATKTLQNFGLISDTQAAGLGYDGQVDNQAGVFADSNSPTHLEFIFAKDSPVAPVTPTTVQFNTTNPPTITVTGTDLLAAGFGPGGLVRVAGSTSNDRDWRIDTAAGAVTTGTITLSKWESVTAEGPSGGITLSGTDGDTRLFRRSWDDNADPGTLSPLTRLDSTNTARVLVHQELVSTSGNTAGLVRLTESSGVYNVSAAVYTASTKSWTSFFTLGQVFDTTVLTGDLSMIQMSMQGENPAVFWLRNPGDAVVSVYNGSGFTDTVLHTNPGPLFIDPAVFVGGVFTSATNGGMAVGDMDLTIPGSPVPTFKLIAYNAGWQTPVTIMTGDVPATLSQGDGFSAIFDVTGDMVIAYVKSLAPATVNYRHYDAAGNAWDSEQSFALPNGRAVYGMFINEREVDGNGSFGFIPASIDQQWIFIQEDAATAGNPGVFTGRQYDAATKTLTNLVTFDPGAGGAIVGNSFSRETSGDTHLFIYQDDGANDTRLYRYFYTGGAWQAGNDRLDDATATIPTTSFNSGSSSGVGQMDFDNLRGGCSKDGVVALLEEVAPGENHTFAAHYDASQAFGSQFEAVTRRGDPGTANENRVRVAADVTGDVVVFWDQAGASNNDVTARVYIASQGGWQGTPITIRTGINWFRLYKARTVTSAGVVSGANVGVVQSFGPQSGKIGQQLYLDIFED